MPDKPKLKKKNFKLAVYSRLLSGSGKIQAALANFLGSLVDDDDDDGDDDDDDDDKKRALVDNMPGFY